MLGGKARTQGVTQNGASNSKHVYLLQLRCSAVAIPDPLYHAEVHEKDIDYLGMATKPSTLESPSSRPPLLPFPSSYPLFQAPRVSRGAARHGGQKAAATSGSPLTGPHTPSSGPNSHALSSHWTAIIQALTALLSTLRATHVPAFLVRRLFTQIFSFINVQLFNR